MSLFLRWGNQDSEEESVIGQVNDRASIHTQVWVQSPCHCIALSPSVDSFSPSSLAPLQKLTCHVYCIACLPPPFPSSVQKGLDVVVPLQVLPTLVPVNYPGRGQAISFPLWVLEQSVLGSCHLSYPSPWPPSNCSSEAFSHPGVESLKSIPPPLP